MATPGTLAAGAARQTARRAAAAQPRERSAAFIAVYQDRLTALATTVPCVAIGFADDADTFAARVREVARAIPASEYMELPGAGHLTPVTDPGLVIGPVLEFFSRVDMRSWPHPAGQT